MMEENKKLTLEVASKTDFPEVFDDMKTYFRENEIKTYKNFISLINDYNYTLLHIKHGDIKVGYIFLFIEQESKFLWPDYLVIKKEFQSKGYGSKILEILKSSYPDMNGIFFEVEHENKAFPDTIRRIRFYEKSGAKKLDLKYIHPNKEGGKPMHLFFLPIKKNFIIRSKEDILKIVKKNFEYMHKDVPDVEQIYEKISNSQL